MIGGGGLAYMFETGALCDLLGKGDCGIVLVRFGKVRLAVPSGL